MTIHLNPIGVIRSSFTEADCSPRQARIDGKKGSLILKEKYCEGLAGLHAFSHIIAIYFFHKQAETKLTAKPCFDPNVEHGIFASRFPSRPNRIGISIYHLDSIEKNILYCSDIDALDGTPLLDIKPYVKYFDQIESPRSGWYDDLDWKEIMPKDSRMNHLYFLTDYKVISPS